MADFVLAERLPTGATLVSRHMWKLKNTLKIMPLMVLRGSGSYFEIYSKIARYFENCKIFWNLQDILKIKRYFENYSVDGVERGWKGQHKRISTGAGVALDIKLIFKPLSTKLSTMCTLLSISLVASILSSKPIMHLI